MNDRIIGKHTERVNDSDVAGVYEYADIHVNEAESTDGRDVMNGWQTVDRMNDR